MQDLVAELETEGYAIVRGFLSPAEIGGNQRRDATGCIRKA